VQISIMQHQLADVPAALFRHGTVRDNRFLGNAISCYCCCCCCSHADRCVSGEVLEQMKQRHNSFLAAVMAAAAPAVAIAFQKQAAASFILYVIADRAYAFSRLLSLSADRCVSGEVLEQMKQRHALSTNGGLIVTYLLDEPSSLPFVQPAAASAGSGDAAGFFSNGSSMTSVSAAAGSSSSSGWRCKPSAVVLWDDGRDYGAGMPVPRQLVDAGCPAAVFAFVKQEQHWEQY
jgi:hypothetical protein